MGILNDLKPKEVFRYFEEICAIPHGSTDTKRISDYCVKFAEKHGFEYIQDECNNVIIFKDGTKGYEDSNPVIIQGHLDMVCEKENDCDIDFSIDGLNLDIKDGYVYAKGTTLGGDDGIAIAYALAILDSDEIEHPPIEAVFTVDEEIGMIGASFIDCGMLKGKTMLNIDSEEEGYLLVSCAGGVTATCHIPAQYENIDDADRTGNVTENNLYMDNQCGKNSVVRILVNGLKGGHSGVEINQQRANANQVLGRILYAISKNINFRIMDISGGLKDNAIPREAYAKILISGDKEHTIEQTVQELYKIADEYNHVLKNEFRITDSQINISVERNSEIVELTESNKNDIKEELEKTQCKVFDEKTTKSVITALVNLPCGIYKMSNDIEGLVQTSLNLGILKVTGNEVIFSFSVRSSVKSEKDELVSRLECLMEVLSGYVTCAGEYPAWEYKRNSRLRDIMIEVYNRQYGENPVIQAIHAGVECGLFAGKIKELDCVSFGPDIHDIHTPKERLDIKSVERVWEYIIEVLKMLK